MSKRFTIKATGKTAAMLLLACLLSVQVVFSQHTVSIDQQYHCEHSLILVPVYASGFSDVGSLQLNMEFDTAVLQYHDVVNVHTQLSSGYFVAHFTDTGAYPYVTIVWYMSGNPLAIPSGKLFDLKFHFSEGATAISFTDDCEIGLTNLNPVEDAVFANGSVEPLVITAQPQDINADQDGMAVFSIDHVGGSAFHWQLNAGNDWVNLSENDVYSGVYTQELTINNVPLHFNDHLYRCLVAAGECVMESDEAVLKVSALGINDPFAKASVRAYPNPFSDKLYFSFSLPVNKFELELVNLLGQTVYHVHIENPDAGQQFIPTGELNPGLYFLRVIHDAAVLTTVKVLKQQ